jgi:hypothetical protein
MGKGRLTKRSSSSEDKYFSVNVLMFRWVFLFHVNTWHKKLLRYVKVKVKLSLCFSFLTEHHAKMAHWGSGDIAPHILHLGTRWRWVVSFTSRPLYSQGKSPWYPLDRRLGGLQSRSGRGGEEVNSQPLPGLEPPIIQPVVQRYTTELYCHTLNNKILQTVSFQCREPFSF